MFSPGYAADIESLDLLRIASLDFSFSFLSMITSQLSFKTFAFIFTHQHRLDDTRTCNERESNRRRLSTTPSPWGYLMIFTQSWNSFTYCLFSHMSCFSHFFYPAISIHYACCLFSCNTIVFPFPHISSAAYYTFCPQRLYNLPEIGFHSREISAREYTFRLEIYRN